MPIQLSLRVEGDTQVRAGLNRYAQTVDRVTREVVKAAMERALKKSIPYRGGASYDVPERGGYVRTGNLGRSGYIEQVGLSTRIRVEAYRDGREYGGYVVGNAEGTGQAWMHVGRWTTLRQAVDAEIDGLTGELDGELQRGVGQAGLE